ncbi:unnamed protein product [Arabidopsis arenosa]|uniref:Aminoacyl-tRNA synthetase class Ia domain-containing protein n=1 Tax=Arabidopsis arenosa TaxID=38785 RepID=A0A8S2AX98_ARAAE|nr:unnamed protein product [Arabidopsis arenosa]
MEVVGEGRSSIFLGRRESPLILESNRCLSRRSSNEQSISRINFLRRASFRNRFFLTTATSSPAPSRTSSLVPDHDWSPRHASLRVGLSRPPVEQLMKRSSLLAIKIMLLLWLGLLLHGLFLAILLCVSIPILLSQGRNKHNGRVYVVAESRLSALPADTKKSNPKPKGGDSAADSYQVLEKFDGASLVGKKYEPLFDYFSDFSCVAFRVVADDYVTDDSGTGIVHCAPAFGEDDYRVCLENKIVEQGENLVVAVDEDGLFTERITHFFGRYVKDADKDIIEAVKTKGRLVKTGSFTHSYPFCYRSDTPLIYRALPCWFVRVEDQLKEQLLENNEQTYWVPDHVKDKRFHNWLENARDWCISRSRFWGTPLPIWISDDGEEVVVMDSVEKLEKLSGVKVFDCWFESGSMPYAYIHYPFENKELFESNFPGHFVAEGLESNSWMPAFRNLICNGLVLAEDGKKMSKSLDNYPPPLEVIDEYGADAVRLYLINSPIVRAEPLRFRKEGVLGVVKDVFLPWYNAYRFLVQNAKRLEIEVSGPFVPTDLSTLRSSNVLDQWIYSATQSLVCFCPSGDGWLPALYCVPYLLKFLDNLTNIYVRFNRKRLKGRTGEDDCHIALSTLYNVLLTSCKVMTPFTPFFTETLYQNLRKACEVCVSKAEPDFSVLGKRLGKSMRLVAKEVKEMSQQDILRFEETGKVTIAGHTLELTDIKIVRVFKRPDGLKDTEIDANGDDDSLYEAGVAREIVNRIQKLRKKSGLEPTDVVEVYIESLDKDESALQQVLCSQEQYIKDTIGSSLLPSTLMPSHAVILSDESFQNVSKLSFKISLARRL